MHNTRCYSAHMGLWMIEPAWFQTALAAIQSGTVEPSAQIADQSYNVTPGGVALIQINGPMMKAASKYGGTSTVAVRQQLRQAALDPAVSAVVLAIESPGGTVAGTAELAADVAAVDRDKPVYAQIEDLGASAAYWVASQARAIFANATAQIGSIGTMATLIDSSRAADMQGIKVHVIASGAMKGTGAPGTEITPDHLAYMQEMVNETNGFFLSAVKSGRKLSPGKLSAVSDGRVFIASKAQEMGLIDGVQGLDATLKAIGKEAKISAKEKRLRAIQIEEA